MGLDTILNYFTVDRLKKHFYVFRIIVLIGSAYGFASYTATEVIAPMFKVKDFDVAKVKEFENVELRKTMPREFYEIIIDRNIFDSTGKPVPGKDSGTLPNMTDSGDGDLKNVAAVKSSLPLKLVGTMVLNNPKWSLAIITGDSESNTNAFMPNDIILSVAVLINVYRNKVIIRNNGRLEYLEIVDESPDFASSNDGASDVSITTTEDGVYNISRRELDEAFKDLGNILTQARVVPHMKDGKTIGFRIFAIQPGSVYEKLGLINQDIITKVNGVMIDDPTKALQLFNALKAESKIKLDFLRDDVKKTYHYNIK